MFVYYFTHVRRSFEAVETPMLALIGGFDGFAAAAYREGEALGTPIGVGGNGEPLIAKKVRIEVGTPSRASGVTTIPLVWEATGAPGLFPRMEADLIVAGLGADLTQISLRGQYEPPLGAVGRALDRALLHRLAEASVKGFVDRIVHSIESAEAAPLNGTA
ncbi:MAG: hypothetical protein ACXVQ6_06335 [Actinomycetota bacterium]